MCVVCCLLRACPLVRVLLYTLRVVRCLVLFACCMLSTIRDCCMVRVARWLPLVGCRVRCVLCRVLLVVCCLSSVYCVWWSGDCWSLFAVRC